MGPGTHRPSTIVVEVPVNGHSPNLLHRGSAPWGWGVHPFPELSPMLLDLSFLLGFTPTPCLCTPQALLIGPDCSQPCPGAPCITLQAVARNLVGTGSGRSQIVEDEAATFNHMDIT